MTLKLATWNVNSIRSRLERLLLWLEKAKPDVLCLQELKVVDDNFPHEAIRAAGYHAAVFGQKTYNGVAILSRQEPRAVCRGFDDGVDDSHARFIAAEIGRLHVLSAYVPNGQTVGSEKYAYKLLWLDRLRAYLARRFTPATPLALCGDLNVARDERDVAHPERWERTVLFHPEVRAALEAVRQWGLGDVVRHHHPEGGIYSWWDYRMLAFPKNDGLRIDHIFATEPLARLCTAASIDRDERKGKQPSDHAPVVAEFEIA
jgi:exodeoxyribonuclease-3